MIYTASPSALTVHEPPPPYSECSSHNYVPNAVQPNSSNFPYANAPHQNYFKASGSTYPSTSTYAPLPAQYPNGYPLQYAPYPTAPPNQYSAYSAYPGAYPAHIPSASNYPTNSNPVYVIPNAFDSGAQFDNNCPITVPPPPPGCAPNVAQMALMNGNSVVLNKKKSNWFTGGKGGGYSFW